MCHNVRLVNDKIYVKNIKCKVHMTVESCEGRKYDL